MFHSAEQPALEGVLETILGLQRFFNRQDAKSAKGFFDLSATTHAITAPFENTLGEALRSWRLGGCLNAAVKLACEM
jgi:hypothetical protein